MNSRCVKNENFGIVPSVSIGMPVYNGEKYIREALDSFLIQTFTDFELIISDNASTDGTREICEEYAKKDDRIKYIRQDENIGATANFKFVLDAARGHFFKWAACDDYIASADYLSVMLSKLDTGYDYCFSAVDIVYENDSRKLASTDVMYRFLNCNDSFSYSLKTVFTPSYQFYGIYNRTLLSENFFYFSKCAHLRCFNEGLLVHAMAAKYNAIYIPSVKLIYRRHDSNWSLVVKERHMVIDFLKFSFLIYLFYMGRSTTYCILQRTKILLLVTLVHGKYFLLLNMKLIMGIIGCVRITSNSEVS